jgi:hypothetical protein
MKFWFELLSISIVVNPVNEVLIVLAVVPHPRNVPDGTVGSP